MNVPEQIISHIEDLKKEFMELEIHEGNPVIVVIEDFPLPLDFKVASTDLLLKIPVSYPNGKPDMFWVEEDAVPNNGKLPFSPVVEDILGRKWLRYSWHPQNWNPAGDNLLTYLEFVREGLIRVCLN